MHEYLPMSASKRVHAQLMSRLSLPTFHRCVARYDGEHKVKHYSCLDQLLYITFAQPACRERLRDIEGCLRSQSSRRSLMGFRNTESGKTMLFEDEDKLESRVVS